MTRVSCPHRGRLERLAPLAAPMVPLVRLVQVREARAAMEMATRRPGTGLRLSGGAAKVLVAPLKEMRIPMSRKGNVTRAPAKDVSVLERSLLVAG